MHDLVIRGAKIVDGSGGAPFVGDVAVKDGLIAAVGVSALTVVAALARGFFGVGDRGRAWWPVFARILGDQPDIVRTHPEWKARWQGSRVVAYRRMGRTQWEVSDVALGAGRLSGERGERIVREALDRGVNYIDTAPDYSAENSSAMASHSSPQSITPNIVPSG